MGVLKTKSDRIELGLGGRSLIVSYAHLPEVNEQENAPTATAVFNTIYVANDTAHVLLPPLKKEGQLLFIRGDTASEHGVLVWPAPGDQFIHEEDYRMVCAGELGLFIGIKPGGQMVWVGQII